MVPLFYCDDMAAALDFYSGRLGFTAEPGARAEDWVVSLFRDGAELMLTRLPTDQVAQINALVLVDSVDRLHAEFKANGLDQSHRTESPVHLGPLDQSWGTRELYVTDPAGNTLRFVQRSAHSS